MFCGEFAPQSYRSRQQHFSCLFIKVHYSPENCCPTVSDVIEYNIECRKLPIAPPTQARHMDRIPLKGASHGRYQM